MPSQQIIVVGGVAAGPAAAAEAVRVDPEAGVLLLEEGPSISYGACEIPYYVEGRIDSADDLVALTPEKFRQKKGADVRVYHRVEEINAERNHIFVRDLQSDSVERLRYDKLILATGARPRVPDIEGIRAENVFPIRRLDEAADLRKYLDKHEVRHAVVVGGGYIGFEMAEALANRNVRCTILEPQGGLLNRYVSPAFREIIHDVVRERGVAIRNESLEGVTLDGKGRVNAVRTDRGEMIGCQAVLICMGVVPNSELAAAAGVRKGKSGALAVDDGMRTNIPGIWACGDVIEVRRVVDDRMVHLPLSPIAFRTSRVAASNAARQGRGAPKRFGGATGASAVKAFGLEVGVAGLREEDARESGIDCVVADITHYAQAALYPGAEKLRVRLMAERGTGRLLGVELIGKEGAALRANVIIPMLFQRGTVSDLLDLDLVYNPPIAPPRDALLIAASQLAREINSGRRPASRNVA
jgi:CoA-dependent NAD(P)H sulfur oxidoreductase